MCDACSTAPAASAGSRRRRLWELPAACHCPVVGVCFSLPRLRQLVNKFLGGKAVADDYEIHVGAVAECGARNRLSQLLQKDLETRYSAQIASFRQAKDARAVAQLWGDAVRRGDVAGPFWAALTHPRCDDALQEVVLRDMHMLQHQAGAAVRLDIAQLQALSQENSTLARELGKAQERSTRALAEKAAELAQVQSQLVQQRAMVISKDSHIAFLAQDLAELKASLPAYEESQKLHKKLSMVQTHNQHLQALNTQLRQTLQDMQQRLQSLEGQVAAATTTSTAPTPCPLTVSACKSSALPLQLQQKNIACVGGRQGSIANYRDIIEQAGGQFSHHDGGVQDKPCTLDAVLAAADLVICQTGCISHNAYWRVKDFCKRTGKQCVFVDNPSYSSLMRNLQELHQPQPPQLAALSNG